MQDFNFSTLQNLFMESDLYVKIALGVVLFAIVIFLFKKLFKYVVIVAVMVLVVFFATKFAKDFTIENSQKVVKEAFFGTEEEREKEGITDDIMDNVLDYEEWLEITITDNSTNPEYALLSIKHTYGSNLQTIKHKYINALKKVAEFYNIKVIDERKMVGTLLTE